MPTSNVVITQISTTAFFHILQNAALVQGWHLFKGSAYFQGHNHFTQILSKIFFQHCNQAWQGVTCSFTVTCDAINQSVCLAGCKFMSSLYNSLSMNRLLETCLVFPRLICRSQLGVELPMCSGHPFKKLVYHIIFL